MFLLFETNLVFCSYVIWESTIIRAIAEIISREQPKSALYLRLKLVKGGPFGLRETLVGCNI